MAGFTRNSGLLVVAHAEGGVVYCTSMGAVEKVEDFSFQTQGRPPQDLPAAVIADERGDGFAVLFEGGQLQRFEVEAPTGGRY